MNARHDPSAANTSNELAESKSVLPSHRQKAQDGTRFHLDSYQLLLIIIVFGAGVRFLFLGWKSFWYDELYDVWSSRLALGSMMREALASGHPPLYYLIGHFWFALGSGEVWDRMVSWAAGAATIWLVYQVGKDLFSRRTGLWGAALAAVAPMLVAYSDMATSYSFVTFLSALSFYFLIRSSKYGGWKNFSGYIASTLAVAATYFYFPALLVAGAMAYFLLRDSKRSNLRVWLSCQVLLALIAIISIQVAKSGTAPGWLVANAWSTKWFIKSLVATPPILFGGDFTWLSLTSNNYKLLGFSLSQLAIIELLPLLILLFIFLFWEHFRKRIINKAVGAIAVWTGVLIVGPVVGESLRSRFTSDRFYAWAIPTAILLFVVIIEALPKKISYAFGAVALASLSFLTIYGSGIFPPNEDWRGVENIIASHGQPGDVLDCFPQHACVVASSFYGNLSYPIVGGFPSGPNLVYFLPPGDVWAGYASGYYTGHGESAPLLGNALTDRLVSDINGAKRVWLVVEGDTSPQLQPCIQKDFNQQEVWRFNQVGQPFNLKLFVKKP